MVDKKAASNIWFTPPEVVKPLEKFFGGSIPLDAATHPSNPTGALKFYTEEDDGLVQDWDEPTFINPPYSDTGDAEGFRDKAARLFGLTKGVSSPIVLWAAKIHAEAVRRPRPIIALLPCGARFSTNYWQDHILIPNLTAMCVVRGRVSFINGLTGERKSGQNNYDSIVYGFNVDVERFAASFRPVGATFAMNFQRPNMMEGFL